ncbi:MAG TPA: alpha/beta family hydrolase [Acidimicrobiia bacterium]|nr:alpha/beta family hydrolase [Acidimicrobiia bacterium]
MDIDIDTPHGAVPSTLELVPASSIGIVLAHGAGAGRQHAWMAAMRDLLVGCGVSVLTFDYAYMAAGRRAPDRLEKLIDVHECVAREMEAMVPMTVLAGKSMGGRVGGHLAALARCRVSGVAYLGYPLVPIGEAEPRPTDHLVTLEVPQLFISGSRDAMGPVELITEVARSVPRGEVVIIESGDHSFVPLKRTGLTLDDTMGTAVDAVVGWLDRVVAQAGGGT